MYAATHEVSLPCFPQRVYTVARTMSEANVCGGCNLSQLIASLFLHSFTRTKVLAYLTEYVHGRNGRDVFLGQVDDTTRHSLSAPYFTLLSQSKIVVTVNPPSWEGDHRLFEALASGALVFVDKESRHLLSHLGLQDRVDVVFYSIKDGEQLKQLLSYYEENESEAQAIAERGRTKAREEMMPENRLDYMTRSMFFT